ncbi:hypothetical protein BDV59DRAFT_196940 [Aspergillus ambiguus]|uniref:GMC family oxidoreductase n=1 Tax=Aspergillus ambiguus TaxID=176160 RepID=UPI003CCD6055
MLFLLLIIIFTAVCAESRLNTNVNSPSTAYDYVIVGGGTAGLTLAYRLAINGSYLVAVVEAGGVYELDNGNGSIIPALAPLQGIGTDPVDEKPLIDWEFYTIPQSGANGRRMHYARGKTLGGCSARNHMLYQRSNIGAYQKWADEIGDETFTFQNLLPYFRRSCHITSPNNTGNRYPANGTVQVDLQAYNTESPGPLDISWPNWAFPLGSWAKKGMESLGIYQSTTGFDTGILKGSGWPAGTISPDNGHRSSSASAFLGQAIDTGRLRVYTHTQATRILFNGSSACAVTVKKNNTQFTLTAMREIALSAGALQSPHLLMVSGVGPREMLDSNGIQIVRDLPGVGRNLQDQPFFGVSYRVRVDTLSRLNDPIFAKRASEEYLSNVTGPLTSGPAYIGWDRLSRSSLSSGLQFELQKLPQDWPDLEYVVENGFDGDNKDYAVSDPQDGYQYGTISASLMSSFSRGNISLDSSNQTNLPLLHTGILEHPWDMEMAVAAFKRLRKLWGAMSGVTIGDEFFPGKQVASNDDIEEYIRKTASLLWHAVGTCSMGRPNNTMSVVDTNGRVFGLNNLRIVDASIFPFLPPGHPMSNVYMIAEKIADQMLSG